MIKVKCVSGTKNTLTLANSFGLQTWHPLTDLPVASNDGMSPSRPTKAHAVPCKQALAWLVSFRHVCGKVDLLRWRGDSVG